MRRGAGRDSSSFQRPPSLKLRSESVDHSGNYGPFQVIMRQRPNQQLCATLIHRRPNAPYSMMRITKP
eukprot:54472-Rhodomonas_salina.1